MQQRDANGIPIIRDSVALILLGFFLVLAMVIAPFHIASGLLMVARGVDEAGDTLPPEWRRLVGTIGVLDLMQLMLLAAAVYLFFGRRRIAPRMIIATIAARIAVDVMDAAWRVSLAQGDSEYIAEVVAPLAPRLVIQIASIAYFIVSKRVKETFVYPMGESEATAASK